jgi:dTDP-4-dehydrorhamnose 3,5-epimerase
VKVSETSLPGVLLLETRAFGDSRGWFSELHHEARYAEAGIRARFVQDNFSHSVRNTLRGLHFQEPNPQGKLVQVVQGAVLDVVVDVRRGSPTFGKSFASELSDGNHRQLWVPPGFAHGFCVLSDTADFLYKCTDFYSPTSERSILWNDPDLGIDWPTREPLLSPKDAQAPRLRDAPALPAFMIS